MTFSAQLYVAFDTDPTPVLEFLRWLVRSYGLQEPVTILDVGCGPGRTLPFYDEFGWTAVAFEPDPDFYAWAASCASRFPGVSVVQGGFLDLRERERFDVAVAINGSFAYLMSPEKRREALRRLYGALKPGGVLFLDLPHLFHFLDHPFVWEERSAEVEGRHVRFVRHHIFNFLEYTFVQWNEYVVREPGRDSRKIWKVHRHALLSYPELAHALWGAGFDTLRTYTDYTLRRPSPLSDDRILVAARRPPG